MLRTASLIAPVPWPVTMRTEIVPRACSLKRNALVRLIAGVTRSPWRSSTGSSDGEEPRGADRTSTIVAQVTGSALSRWCNRDQEITEIRRAWALLCSVWLVRAADADPDCLEALGSITEDLVTETSRFQRMFAYLPRRVCKGSDGSLRAPHWPSASPSGGTAGRAR